MIAFWNKITKRCKWKVTSSLHAQSFADLYSVVMNDDDSDLDEDQININKFVHNKVSEHKGLVEHKDFEDDYYQFCHTICKEKCITGRSRWHYRKIFYVR